MGKHSSAPGAYERCGPNREVRTEKEVFELVYNLRTLGVLWDLVAS